MTLPPIKVVLAITSVPCPGTGPLPVEIQAIASYQGETALSDLRGKSLTEKFRHANNVPFSVLEKLMADAARDLTTKTQALAKALEK